MAEDKTILVDGVGTAIPIQWTIPRVDPDMFDEKYYKMRDYCDDNCHHPVHAFNEDKREKHLIEKDLVEVALRHNWWNDVFDSMKGNE